MEAFISTFAPICIAVRGESIKKTKKEQSEKIRKRSQCHRNQGKRVIQKELIVASAL